LKVCIFSSYKGGSGKSLISINTAVFLSNRGYKVLLIDGDLEGPIFHRIFKEITPQTYLNQFLKREDIEIRSLIHSAKNFDVIFSSPRFQQSDILITDNYEFLLDRITDIKQEIHSLQYDYIIIDLAPGINYFGIAALILADMVNLVVRPDNNSVEGASIMIDRIYKNTIRVGEKHFTVIFNQIPDHDGFNEAINHWEIILKDRFPIINSNLRIPFLTKTSYNFYKYNSILPLEDEFFNYIAKLLEI
jgi:MinD-like ATPase involved in chromosome partitioning or flagellar assembly